MGLMRRLLCWLVTGHVYDEWHPTEVVHQDLSWGPPETHWATTSPTAIRFCGYCGKPDWSRIGPVCA